MKCNKIRVNQITDSLITESKMIQCGKLHDHDVSKRKFTRLKRKYFQMACDWFFASHGWFLLARAMLKWRHRSADSDKCEVNTQVVSSLIYSVYTQIEADSLHVSTQPSGRTLFDSRNKWFLFVSIRASIVICTLRLITMVWHPGMVVNLPEHRLNWIILTTKYTTPWSSHSICLMVSLSGNHADFVQRRSQRHHSLGKVCLLSRQFLRGYGTNHRQNSSWWFQTYLLPRKLPFSLHMRGQDHLYVHHWWRERIIMSKCRTAIANPSSFVKKKL